MPLRLEGTEGISSAVAMGGAVSGAMDANAFHAAVRDHNDLPEASTLSYQGKNIKDIKKQ